MLSFNNINNNSFDTLNKFKKIIENDHYLENLNINLNNYCIHSIHRNCKFVKNCKLTNYKN